MSGAHSPRDLPPVESLVPELGAPPRATQRGASSRAAFEPKIVAVDSEATMLEGEDEPAAAPALQSGPTRRGSLTPVNEANLLQRLSQTPKRTMRKSRPSRFFQSALSKAVTKADIAEVVAFLVDEKPEMTHVVLTGRNAKEELLEIADLATEMELLKHPFRSGIKAQIGVEY